MHKWLATSEKTSSPYFVRIGLGCLSKTKANYACIGSCMCQNAGICFHSSGIHRRHSYYYRLIGLVARAKEASTRIIVRW